MVKKKNKRYYKFTDPRAFVTIGKALIECHHL